MALFQKSVLKNHFGNLNLHKLEAAWERFQAHFHSTEIQQNIRHVKEEQYQEGFITDLFVNVLGYVKHPSPKFNITTELKNIGNTKKADGAILKNGDALAVIELKGTKHTNLGKVEPQAFGYKSHHPTCKYVIISNFEKLRFYIDNAVDFVEFNLFTLTKEDFKLLWLCLEAGNLLRNLPQQVKNESLVREEVITKELYKDYSTFRTVLFEDIQRRNPQHDKLTLFNKTQKLLDRFIFIFFAEDRGLMKANTISIIIQEYDDLNIKYGCKLSLYERFKEYFNRLNVGFKNPEMNIFAYNGGLFAPDALLDSIEIDDLLLREHTYKLSAYDFESDVSVNILGHIFEHSLTEIEEIQQDLAGEAKPSTSKRKKDGVFYTPKYITKYIVENTVGKLCEAQKGQLGIQEEDYELVHEAGEEAIISALQDKLSAYRHWLLQLTICDPACGSGAFLNQALEFLIAEHQYIDELAAKLAPPAAPKPKTEAPESGLFAAKSTAKTEKSGSAFTKDGLENEILKNNLFGVDINGESVEIAKLSLWLRTAKRGRKLTTLNDNLKVGNSLIDDPEVAGEKAFDWQKEFPHIFEKGGFDVVIGNPPYGAKIDKKDIKHLLSEQEVYGLSKVLSDTYIAFYIKSLTSFLRDNGVLGFITPNTWRLVQSGEAFRNFMLNDDFSVLKITQHLEKVFIDATVDCDTVIMQKKEKHNNQISLTIRHHLEDTLSHHFSQREMKKKRFINLFLTEHIYRLKAKIEVKSHFVKDFYDIKNGVKPYERGKGKPAQTAEVLKNKPFTSVIKIDESFLPLLGGSQFHRYQLLWKNDYWIKYGEWLAAPRDKAIFETKEKLIFRQTSDKIIGHYLYNGFVVRNNTHILLRNAKSTIELKCLLALLNSRLIDFYYWTLNPERGEALAEVKAFHLGLLPFPKDIPDQVFFIEKADKMLSLNADLQKVERNFLALLEENLSLPKVSKKLQKWYDLDFKGFLKELGKQKIKIQLAEQGEWREFFQQEQAKAQKLLAEIQQTDAEIDAMVYALYGLTEEEIKIVEDSGV